MIPFNLSPLFNQPLKRLECNLGNSPSPPCRKSKLWFLYLCSGTFTQKIDERWWPLFCALSNASKQLHQSKMTSLGECIQNQCSWWTLTSTIKLSKTLYTVNSVQNVILLFLFALGGCSQNVVILVSLCGLQFVVAQNLCAPHLYVCKQLKLKIQNGGSMLYALCLCHF
jgi:hypothetical protein